MSYCHDWLRKRLAEEGLTAGEVKYMVDKISNAMRGKDCIDNFRLSVDGKNNKAYKEAIANGC